MNRKHSTDPISDGAWRRAAGVAVLVIAGLAALAAPRSPSSPAPAAAEPGATMSAAQSEVPDSTSDVGDEDDSGDAQPFPIFEDTPKSTAADTSSVHAGARPDSATILPAAAGSAEPETLRYVPPGEAAIGAGPHGKKPNDEPAAIVKKPKQGFFGLPPIFIIAGLTAVHVFVVSAVNK